MVRITKMILISPLQLDKVAKKIDRWHESKSKNPDKFENDEEYVELDHSPTNFSSSDEEGYD